MTGEPSRSARAWAQSATASDARGWHGSVTALDIKLTADHGGLPAGRRSSSATRRRTCRAAVAPDPDGSRHNEPDPRRSHSTRRAARPCALRRSGPGPSRASRRIPSAGAADHEIPNVHPKLTAGRLRLPGLRPASRTATPSARRGPTSVWHHGDDIFAPLGAPILAVADGTVFSVGWNDDRRLTASGCATGRATSSTTRTSPRSRRSRVNGAQVQAGHRARLRRQHRRRRGNAVPPPLRDPPGRAARPGLRRRRRPDAVPRRVAAPAGHPLHAAGAAGCPGSCALDASRAPEPGAILLQVSDISSASGLDPGSLRRALAPVAPRADVALAGALPRRGRRARTRAI